VNEARYELVHLACSGKRNDLLLVKAAIDDGNGIRDLWDDHFPNMVRYGRSLTDYKRLKTEPRTEPPMVMVLWGPTGTGKTRFAHTLGAYFCGNFYGVYVAPPAKASGRYYDDYDGHDVIIFDEFYGYTMPWTQLLTITDRYPSVLPTHGGAGRQNVAKLIIFTSNKHPFFWYNQDKINWTPFCRRISLCVKLGSYAPPQLRDKVPVVEVSSCPVGWRQRPGAAVAARGVVGRLGFPKKKTVVIDGVMYEQK